MRLDERRLRDRGPRAGQGVHPLVVDKLPGHRNRIACVHLKIARVVHWKGNIRYKVHRHQRELLGERRVSEHRVVSEDQRGNHHLLLPDFVEP